MDIEKSIFHRTFSPTYDKYLLTLIYINIDTLGGKRQNGAEDCPSTYVKLSEDREIYNVAFI